jgi:hypothetical protein
MRLLIFILFCLVSSQVFAEGKVKVYKSYSHFLAKDAEEYDYQDFDQNYYLSGYSKPILTVTKNGKKIKLDMLEYWSFEYKGIFFRREYKTSTYQALLSSGKLFYWESAKLILIILESTKSKIKLIEAWSFMSICMSNSLDGEMKFSNGLIDFFNENPELKKVAQCYNNKSEVKISDFFIKNQKLGNDKELQKLIYLADINREYYDKKERKILRDCVKEFNGNFLPIFAE